MNPTLFRAWPCPSLLATGLSIALALAGSDAVASGAGGGHRLPHAGHELPGAHPPIAASRPPDAALPQVPVLPVSSCDDDGGPGSLRSVIAGAPSGAIVDLGALTCSTLSLANGAIAVPVDSLEILGPAAGITLAADQSYRRLIEHSGHGTLSLKNLTLTGGWAGIASAANGGCLYSAGSVELDRVAVLFCKAVSGPGDTAKGGGLYVLGGLQMRHSTVSGNQTNPGSIGYGGGAFVAGELDVRYSTISDNYTLNLYVGGSFGGGLFALGNVSIVASTIATNHAVNVGALSIAGYAAGAVIVNSTISGNVASNVMAGVYSNTPLAVYGSTIAFNSAGAQSSSVVTAAGLQVFATSADLQSSIIAGNTAASVSFDVGEQDGSLGGANNLIRTSSDLLPADTITEDPQLLPLANNGGDTATLALAATSPAIDRGNNAGATSFDQRGDGYTRVVGAAADIGAFELQPAAGDLVFRDGFDGGM